MLHWTRHMIMLAVIGASAFAMPMVMTGCEDDPAEEQAEELEEAGDELEDELD